MRRDHRPAWMRRLYGAAEAAYIHRFVRPQFERLGEGAVITLPWNLEVFGSGISAGAHLNLFTAPGLRSRLTTWKHPQTAPRITIGDHVLISPSFLANAAREIVIGDNSMIASQVYISDSDWHGLYDRVSEPDTAAPVILEENVWIGFRAIVGKGVRIGRNSVIGAGSVVVGSIPENCIAAGNPAKVVRQLDVDRPMRTRADLFNDPDALARWTQALVDAELAGNTSFGWLRARLAPGITD